MYSILDIILVLKEKRDKLNLNREVNLVKIQECERLIHYYCTLYSRTLGSINKKRENLDMYDGLLEIKEKIQSPRWIEAIVPLSYKFINKRRSSLISKIDNLTERSYELRENVELYQRKKFLLKIENDQIEKKLGYIDEGIKHPDSSLNKNSYIKKLVLKR